MTLARRSIGLELVAWIVFALVAVTVGRASLLDGVGFRVASGLAVVCTGAAFLVSLSVARSGEWAFGSIVALPMLMLPLATAVDPPVLRVLAMASSSLVLPAAAWWLERALGRRRQSGWMILLAAALAMSVADLLYRDPYHELNCPPICPRNPLLLQHAPSVLDFVQWAVFAIVLVWATATTASMLRRQPIAVPIRVAAAIGVAVTLVAAGEIVRRESRSPTSQTAIAVPAGSMVALSIAIVLTVLPLVTEAIGRRRVVRWATTIQEASRPGTALAMLRDASGDQSLSFAGDGSIGLLDGHRATTELHRGGRVVAVIEHRPESSDRLRKALTPPVVTALENELLLSTATRQLGDLRSARRRVVERGDEARRRLERDLHDGAQQRLLALGMQLSALSQRTGGEERARLDAAVDHATLALSSLRRLADGVVPPLLDDAGLFEAIMSLAEQTDVPLVLDIESIAGQRFGPEVERAAYRLVTSSVAEAINACSPDVVVAATVIDSHLVVATRHQSDACAPRLDDADRVAAAGGTLASARVGGATVLEARFG